MVGDTLCLASQAKEATPFPGFRKIHPNVYLDMYPAEGNQYQDLVDALERLKLNDSAISTQGINSPILGQGVKVGFLGLLHSEVVGERLEREFNLPVIAVSPSVEYKITFRNGEDKIFSSVAEFPDPSQISKSFEPLAAVKIVVTSPYVGAVMQLCQDLRGSLIDVSYLDQLVEIDYFLPLIEVITSLHDNLKSVSSGFASLDYELAGWQPAELVKLDVLLNHEVFPPMSVITVKEKARASAILFNRSEFGKYFAQGIPGYQGEDVDIANLSELNFELENKDGLNTDNLDTINFTLEGEAEIIWKFDNQKLIDDLQQADNKDYHSVFANYPEILKADIDFRPRWIKTVPTNPSKIIIEIAND